MHRMPLIGLVLFACTLLIVPPAGAATGSVADPAGDFPDIRRLSYTNANARVVMTMRYTRLAAVQNQSFYIHWGTSPAYYQVFVTRSATGVKKQLRFKAADTVACKGLRVRTLRAIQGTRVVVPRSCLRRAPDRLRFRGIATRGVSAHDETVRSPSVRRG
jgi:hypothetical protein